MKEAEGSVVKDTPINQDQEQYSMILADKGKCIVSTMEVVNDLLQYMT